MGDGRAVLRSSIREFLGSEALHHLESRPRGLSRWSDQTSRSFAKRSRPLRSLPAYVAELHPLRLVRVLLLERSSLDALASTCGLRDRHGSIPSAPIRTQPYLAFLEQVARRTAHLVAQWQGVGFCHGVLNTDNMSILGAHDRLRPILHSWTPLTPVYICNHSDYPAVATRTTCSRRSAHWNLYALGQALVALTEDVDATKSRN